MRIRLLLSVLISLLLTSGLFAAPGTIDTTFGGVGAVETTFPGYIQVEVRGVAADDAGVVVVASGMDPNYNSVILIARFRSDGSLDTDFGTQGKTVIQAELMSGSPCMGWGHWDGGYIGATKTVRMQGLDVPKCVIFKLGRDGKLNGGFGGGSGYVVIGGTIPTWDYPVCMTVPAGGGVVVACNSSAISDGLNGVVLAKVDTNGNPDVTFGWQQSGWRSTPISYDLWGEVTCMTTDIDGRILLGGTAWGDFLLMRYTAWGELDTSLPGGGILGIDMGGDYDEVKSVAVDGDGRMFLAGKAWPQGENGQRFAMLVLGWNGGLATTFGDNGVLSPRDAYGNRIGPATRVTCQPDGKILVLAETWVDPSTSRQSIVRLNRDGAYDTTFGNGGVYYSKNIGYGTYSDHPHTLVDLSLNFDGKILAAGTSSFPNGAFVTRINGDWNNTDTPRAILSKEDSIIAVDSDVTWGGGNVFPVGGTMSSTAQPSDYPGSESPAKAIDGTTATKYLNFGEVNSGFIVTPSAGSSIVRGFEMWTGNDHPERDPTSFRLYGTNSSISSTDNSTGTGETWTLITQGILQPPTARNTSIGKYYFDNATAYSSYKWIVNSVRDASSANSMQFSEIQFYEKIQPQAQPTSLAPSYYAYANDYFSYFAAAGNYSLAYAYYYYFLAYGNYYACQEVGDLTNANFQLQYCLGLYYYNLFMWQGSTALAAYYYYYQLGLAYYNWYLYQGDYASASYYLNYYWYYANYYYVYYSK